MRWWVVKAYYICCDVYLHQLRLYAVTVQPLSVANGSDTVGIGLVAVLVVVVAKLPLRAVSPTSQRATEVMVARGGPVVGRFRA